jgi:heterodisulfide reductase subunit A-like polyferredoxin
MELDMLVLMAGMEMSEGGTRIAEAAKLNIGENRFFAPLTKKDAVISPFAGINPPIKNPIIPPSIAPVAVSII